MSLSIQIKDIKGRSKYIEANEADTMESVLDKIKLFWPISSSSSYTLVHGGRQISVENLSRTVRESGISNMGVIHVLVRMRGGSSV